jgi:uncharacterized protein YxjI
MDLYGSNFASGDTLTFVDPQGNVYANRLPTVVASNHLQYSFNDGNDPGTWSVQVISAAGNSASYSFSVAAAVQAPSLSSVSPTSYSADTNQHTMDLYGSNFASGDTLTFVDPQGNVYANRVPTLITSAHLQYSFNDGNDPGTWSVQVISSAGNSSTFSFAVNASSPPPTPTITSMLPTSLPADTSQHLLDIYGTHFANGDTLTFKDPQGNVYANKLPTIVSATQLEYSFNDGNDPGSWSVQVNSPAGNSSAFAFTVNAASPPPTPTVSSMLPTSVPADTNQHLLDIYGTHFASGDTLTFVDPQGNVYANKLATIVSGTQLEYFFNDNNHPGSWTVQVNDPSGISNTFSFPVVGAAAPTVTRMSPTSLPTDSSKHLLDIYGSNFARGDTLTFIDPQGNHYADGGPTIVSSTQLETFLNDGSDPGTWTVQVNSPTVGSSTGFTFSVTAPQTTLIADIAAAKALIDAQFDPTDTSTWRTHDVSSVDQIAHDLATEYGTASTQYVIGTAVNTDSSSVAANRGFSDGFINPKSLLETPDPDNAAHPNQFLDQCVALVKALDHNEDVLTGSWSRGLQLYSNGGIQAGIAPGTPIATFEFLNNRWSYDGDHAAFFLGASAENGMSGFFVLDQFNFPPNGSPLFPDGTAANVKTYEHAEVRFISLGDPYLSEYYTIGPATGIISQAAPGPAGALAPSVTDATVDPQHSWLLAH